MEKKEAKRLKLCRNSTFLNEIPPTGREIIKPGEWGSGDEIILKIVYNMKGNMCFSYRFTQNGAVIIWLSTLFTEKVPGHRHFCMVIPTGNLMFIVWCWLKKGVDHNPNRMNHLHGLCTVMLMALRRFQHCVVVLLMCSEQLSRVVRAWINKTGKTKH